MSHPLYSPFGVRAGRCRMTATRNSSASAPHDGFLDRYTIISTLLLFPSAHSEIWPRDTVQLG
jgi:hypothetical protein